MLDNIINIPKSKVLKEKKEDYSLFLISRDFTYSEDKHWFTIGEPFFDNIWLLFISIRPLDISAVLSAILPILKSEGVAFKLIKNQNLHFALNEGLIVNDKETAEVVLDFAKAVTIYPTTLDQAQNIFKKICEPTRKFNGPEILDATQISSIVYTCFSERTDSEEIKGEYIYSIIQPQRSSIPFSIQKDIPSFNLKKRIYGRSFIPISVVRETSKGIIYKAINIKRFKLTWCLLKIGKAFAFEDVHNRDIRTRLHWESEVLHNLDGVIRVPHVISTFDGENYTCLVLEWIEGKSLSSKVREIKDGRSWIELNSDDKRNILHLYYEMLVTIDRIHSAGFIHRDVTCSNFLILDNGEICSIDFELCYNKIKNYPDPPYSVGTYGYMSPQQVNHEIPTIYDDIYSLGSVLLHLVTGEDPIKFYNKFKDDYPDQLFPITGDINLTQLIIKCLKEDPYSRPKSVKEVIADISSH